MLVRSGAVDVVAVDSVAALTPRAELEGQMGDQTVGLQARMMSQAMRKLAGNLNRTQTLCIFTNQIREKIGVMFGSPETQPGGRALKFYSSQRLDIRRIETLKDGTEAVGNRVRVKVVKNKVAAPFRQAEFDIEFGKGISTSGCLIDLGIEHNIVTKSGSFFSYGDERLGQGRNNAKAYLDEHPEVAKEIEAKIYEALGIDRIARAAKATRVAEKVAEKAADPGRRPERSAEPRGPRLRARARACVRATSTSATARSPRRAATCPQAGRAGEDAERRRRALVRAGLPRRRPLRPALRRGPAHPRPLGLRAHRGAPGRWASSARSPPRRRRGRARGRARAPRSRCSAAASPRPRDDRERKRRALGILVRKGYDLELAHDAIRAHAAGGPPGARTRAPCATVAARYYDHHQQRSDEARKGA